jgi:hypothetical protein
MNQLPFFFCKTQKNKTNFFLRCLGIYSVDEEDEKGTIFEKSLLIMCGCREYTLI